MNNLPTEVVTRCISFFDFESTKSFSMTCKYNYELVMESQNYIAPFLSSYFTKQLPQDGKVISNLQARIIKNFEAANFCIEKPFTIPGKKLQELSQLLGQKTKSAFTFKLLLYDCEDIICASDSKHDTLFPRVCSVEYRDNHHSDHVYVEQQRERFIKFVQQTETVQKLIFGDTAFYVLCEDFRSVGLCRPATRELEFNLVMDQSAEERIVHLLQCFPKVEKFIFHHGRDYRPGGRYSYYRPEGPAVAESSVKELVFSDSSVTFVGFLRILQCIRGVEKVVILRHKSFLNFMQSTRHHRSDPLLSVRELLICEISYKCEGSCTYHLNGSIKGCSKYSCGHDLDGDSQEKHEAFNNIEQIRGVFLRLFPNTAEKITITEEKCAKKKSKTKSQRCVIS